MKLKVFLVAVSFVLPTLGFAHNPDNRDTKPNKKLCEEAANYWGKRLGYSTYDVTSEIRYAVSDPEAVNSDQNKKKYAATMHDAIIAITQTENKNPLELKVEKILKDEMNNRQGLKKLSDGRYDVCIFNLKDGANKVGSVLIPMIPENKTTT